MLERLLDIASKRNSQQNYSSKDNFQEICEFTKVGNGRSQIGVQTVQLEKSLATCIDGIICRAQKDEEGKLFSLVMAKAWMELAINNKIMLLSGTIYLGPCL